MDVKHHVYLLYLLSVCWDRVSQNASKDGKERRPGLHGTLSSWLLWIDFVDGLVAVVRDEDYSHVSLCTDTPDVRREQCLQREERVGE